MTPKIRGSTDRMRKSVSNKLMQAGTGSELDEMKIYFSVTRLDVESMAY